MARLKDETRIKVCLLRKLLENESLNSIANLPNQPVKEEATLPLNSEKKVTELNSERKKTALNKYIAHLLNQYIKEEEVTPGCVSSTVRESKNDGAPYNQYEWQFCISKSVFKCIVEEDKPVQEKLLDLVTHSEIKI